MQKIHAGRGVGDDLIQAGKALLQRFVVKQIVEVASQACLEHDSRLCTGGFGHRSVSEKGRVVLRQCFPGEKGGEAVKHG